MISLSAREELSVIAILDNLPVKGKAIIARVRCSAECCCVFEIIASRLTEDSGFTFDTAKSSPLTLYTFETKTNMITAPSPVPFVDRGIVHSSDDSFLYVIKRLINDFQTDFHQGFTFEIPPPQEGPL